MKLADLMEARQDGAVLTLDDLASLPTVVDPKTAFKALGIASTLGYELLGSDAFPVPVLRLGRAWRIPTVGLLRALGILDQEAE
jgi:hypothetical protein